MGDLRQCECINENHPNGRCASMIEWHHFCGPCQSEGAVRWAANGLTGTAPDDERFEQWWRTGLVDPQFRTIAHGAWHAALRLVSNGRERERSRAERAERRCLELSVEAGEWKRAYLSRIAVLATADGTIDALRANLADANAREGNMQGQIDNMGRTIDRLLADQESHAARCPLRAHVCPSAADTDKLYGELCTLRERLNDTIDGFTTK